MPTPAPTPVTVQTTRIDTFFLPDNFSTPYKLYVLQQSTDLSNVATQANNAASSSHDNSVVIAALQDAVDQNTSDIGIIENRLTIDETQINENTSNITDLQTHVIRDDTTAPQGVVSVFDTTQYYSVNGIQVVTSQETGWVADTGTAILGGMNADLAFTVSATYTQSEVEAIATALVEARKQIKALTDLVMYHGLAGI